MSFHDTIQVFQVSTHFPEASGKKVPLVCDFPVKQTPTIVSLTKNKTDACHTPLTDMAVKRQQWQLLF